MKNAFSLVELSIVLVILGLLVGGVLTGQSLIRAAELRSVTTQVSQLSTGIFTFRDRFFALPGDMRNATDFWGIAAGTTGNDATCRAASGTATATCNGNGDGKIGGGTNNNEIVRTWQHMANAGLVEGSYTGIGSPILPGENLPRGKISNTGFALYWSNLTGSVTTDTSEPNRFIFGLPSTGGTLSGATLIPEEMWNLDTKFDDGIPQSGKMIGLTGFTPANACSASASEYLLSATGTACYFTYILF